MNTKWTFRGVSRVAGTEPEPARQEAPLLTIGKKTEPKIDGKQP